MAAVHAGQRHVVAQQAAAHLQGHEVAGDQQHAAAFGLQALQVLQAFDACTCRRIGVDRAPPGAREFEQADAESRKLARSSVSRAASSISGKHSARLTRGVAPAARPSAGHSQPTSRPSAALQRPRQPRQRQRRPTPSHTGHGAGRAVDGQVGVDGFGHGFDSSWPSRMVMPARHPILEPASRILSRMRADPTERILRGLYSVALYVLAPITVYHLIWRGFRQPAYFQRWNERYASYPRAHRRPRRCGCMRCRWARSTPPRRWSTALLREHPGLRLVVTTITPTGSERVRALVGRCGGACVPALRLARRGDPIPRSFPPGAGADRGNRAVAEPAVRLPRPRHSHVHPQCAAVGALAARLSRAGATDPPRVAAACAWSPRSPTKTASVSCAWARRPRTWWSPAT